MDTIILLILAGLCLGGAFLCFRPLFWAARSSAKDAEKSLEELGFEIIEPEETEEERQFRVYGNCYGYDYNNNRVDQYVHLQNMMTTFYAY